VTSSVVHSFHLGEQGASAHRSSSQQVQQSKCVAQVGEQMGALWIGRLPDRRGVASDGRRYLADAAKLTQHGGVECGCLARTPPGIGEQPSQYRIGVEGSGEAGGQLGVVAWLGRSRHGDRFDEVSLAAIGKRDGRPGGGWRGVSVDWARAGGALGRDAESGYRCRRVAPRDRVEWLCASLWGHRLSGTYASTVSLVRFHLYNRAAVEWNTRAAATIAEPRTAVDTDRPRVASQVPALPGRRRATAGQLPSWCASTIASTTSTQRSSWVSSTYSSGRCACAMFPGPQTTVGMPAC